MSEFEQKETKGTESADLLGTVRAGLRNMTSEERKWPNVAILTGPSECIEIIVQKASKETGFAMNWGYVGGRAGVYSLGDRAKCRAAIYQAIPKHNIEPNEYFV